MFYIPDDWIKNKKNEAVIHDILNKNLSSDLNINLEQLKNELTDIGETTIIKKIEDGSLMLN